MENPRLDLHGYDVENKQSLHFYLALEKTLRLKSRALRVCLCEMLLPPVMVLAMIFGWLASTDKHYPEAGYTTGAVDYTELLRDVVCTEGFTAEQDLFAPYIRKCEPSECGSYMWPTNKDLSGPQLCGIFGNTSDRIYGAMAAIKASEKHPTTIPPLDTLVVMQAIAQWAQGDLSGGGNGPWTDPLRMNGNLQFVTGSGTSCDEAKAVIAHMQNTSKLFSSIYQTTLEARNNPSCPEVWSSEDDAVTYAKGDASEFTLGLVVLDEINFDANEFAYTLRLNHSGTPKTSIETTADLDQGLGDHPSKRYIASGFATLQNLLSGYFVDGSASVWEDVVTFPMPTEEYTNYEFLRSAGGLLVLAIALAFLYPISVMTGGVVEEKENRVREGMLIMGLSKTAFFLSWYVSYLMILGIAGTLLTVFACVSFFSHTSFLLLLLMTLLFVMTLVAQGLLFSVFFSKARIASIAAPLLGFMMILPRFWLDDNSSSGAKGMASLSSTVAYGFGIDRVIEYETVGTGGSFAEISKGSFSFGMVIFMLMLDIVLYLFLFWYFDNVLPSQYGVKRSPLFLFSPTYWGCIKHKAEQKNLDAASLPKTLPHCVDTEIDETTRAEMQLRERVRIMGLRLDFPSPDGHGERNVAVDNLGKGVSSEAIGGGDAVTFYEGQVQCVLGHNGAGKTTLINMLTGMYTPTDGDCHIWGKSIITDMDEIRNNIGVCPQHNILWAKMSCVEHLTFYGRLKGVPSDVLKSRVEQMLKMVNLYEKQHAWSETLSGGQKRKLSVGCALIGGSKLIFLDEPTAGMDVESRRSMWRLLRDPEVLKGRVIVLTTHYMEEADVLGDSVAIMHKGCLHSWGSPFFLKSKLGVGYNMTVAMKLGSDPDAVEAFIKSELPRAEVARISCTGTELRLRVPTDSLPDDEGMDIAVTHLNIARNSTASQIRTSVNRLIETHGQRGSGILSDSLLQHCHDVLSSMRTVASFPTLFNRMDAKKDALQIEGTGVSMTTLEEVFMKIEAECHEEDLEREMRESITTASHAAGGSKMHAEAPADARHSTISMHDFGQLYTITNEEDPPTTGTVLYQDQFRAMFLKRFNCAKRDTRTLCFQFVFPVVMIILALIVGSLNAPTQGTLEMEASIYDTPSIPFVSTGDALTTYAFAGYAMLNVTAEDASVVNADTLSVWSDGHRANKDVDRPFGIAAAQNNVLSNESFYHALPSAMRGTENARMKQVHGESSRITVSNHPLPRNEYRSEIINSVKTAITAILILIPFSFLPSNFVSFVVKEKQCRAKHVQIVSGANLAAYWASTFLFDLASYGCTMFLAFLVFFIAGRDEYVGDFTVFMATFLLFAFYGVAAAWSSYMMSFLFQSHSAAQSSVIGFNFIAGFVTVIVVITLQFVDSTKDIATALQYIFRLIPSFALGDGIVQLSLRTLYTSIDGLSGNKSAFAWDIAGADIMYLACSSPVYFLATLLLESDTIRGKLKRAMKGKGWTHTEDSAERPLLSANATDADCFNEGEYHTIERDEENVMHRRGAWLMCKDLQTGTVYYFNERTGESKYHAKGTPFHRDENVVAHAKEVNAAEHGRDGDFVTVQGLRKVWPARGNAPQKVAVSDVTFGVKRGELFAFLGTNGAGKTTTLSVLSGEIPPTSGRALIAGHDVELEPHLARQNVGYCPQFDALLDNLTCEEHLELYSRLRGIPMKHRKESTEVLLEGLGLDVHRKKQSAKLSGGNKRKLSVAIALIGGPAAVLLDEPSAGMDPVARRSLWGALEKAITDLKLSVVLTTHHLEEVEGLSRLDHRVTIMVDGRLQCLGNLSTLKSQLGDAYELTLKVTSAAAETALCDFIKKTWVGTELVESNQQRLSFQVPKSQATLSQMFEIIENGREKLCISDYSINEMSLEQVFIRISERAVRDEDVVWPLILNYSKTLKLQNYTHNTSPQAAYGNGSGTDTHTPSPPARE